MSNSLFFILCVVVMMTNGWSAVKHTPKYVRTKAVTPVVMLAVQSRFYSTLRAWVSNSGEVRVALQCANRTAAAMWVRSLFPVKNLLAVDVMSSVRSMAGNPFP